MTNSTPSTDELDSNYIRSAIADALMHDYGMYTSEANEKAKAKLAAHTAQEVIKELEAVLNLPDMQIEHPYTHSRTSARHARNKLKEERLRPAIEQRIKALQGGDDVRS